MNKTNIPRAPKTFSGSPLCNPPNPISFPPGKIPGSNTHFLELFQNHKLSLKKKPSKGILAASHTLIGSLEEDPPLVFLTRLRM
jgi:hypothetical protein